MPSMVPPGNRVISYANEDDIYTKARAAAPEHDEDIEQIKAALKARLLGQSTDGVDGSGYSQVDLRPSWYRRFLSKNNYDISGPPVSNAGHDLAGGVLDAAASGAAANAARFAQLPGARAGDIMNMQRKANAAGMLSSGLGAILNKKSRDFDTQQKRAAMEAGALRKHAKTGASNNELLGYLNYDKTQVRNDELAQREARAEAHKVANADKNSPESRRAQVAAASSGVVDPVVANETSREDLEKWRPAFQQTQAQENAIDRFDYEQAQLEGRNLSAEERAEFRRIQTERREAEARRRESFVPGREWANNTPPSSATVAEVRTLTADRDEMMKGAERLAKLQARLEELNGLAAAVGQTVEAYIGDAESKQLLAEAKLIQSKMSTAARRLDNMGVPQQFELELQNSLNPVAGTLSAYFRGRAPWDAIKKYYDETGEAQLRTRGSFPAGAEDRPNQDPHAKPAEQEVQRFPRPVAPRPHKSPRPRGEVVAPLGVSAPASEFGAQPGDSLPTTSSVPPIPADARKPAAASAAGPGMFEVSKDGKKFRPRALSIADQQNLQQQGFTLTPVSQ